MLKKSEASLRSQIQPTRQDIIRLTLASIALLLVGLLTTPTVNDVAPSPSAGIAMNKVEAKLLPALEVSLNGIHQKPLAKNSSKYSKSKTRKSKKPQNSLKTSRSQSEVRRFSVAENRK